MTFPEFDQFFDGMVLEIKQMRNTKGKEYAHEEDRFANFNRLAKELDLQSIQIAFVYFKKHMDSITSFVKTGKYYSNETPRGRFIDAILYLFLMAGLEQEKREEIRKLADESELIAIKNANAERVVRPYDHNDAA